jgi:prominin 1
MSLLHFQLPDVTLIIDGVTDLSSSDLVDKLNDANNVLADIKTDISDSVRSRIPEVRVALRKAGDAMKDAANEMTVTIDRVTHTTNANTFKYFDTADEYVQEYSIYRYYGGLAISSVLLLVLLCIFLGLTCGICGKRPNGYGDDCCNKGAGGKFLML